MEQITALKALYEEYNYQATKIRREARPFDGFMGLGNDPRKNPCHDQFYRGVGAWVERFLAGSADPQLAAAAATVMVEAPYHYRNQEGFWYICACVGFVSQLVPLMAKEDCAALAQRFNDLYPKHERLPVQQNVFKQLRKAGK